VEASVSTCLGQVAVVVYSYALQTQLLAITVLVLFLFCSATGRFCFLLSKQNLISMIVLPPLETWRCGWCDFVSDGFMRF